MIKYQNYKKIKMLGNKKNNGRDVKQSSYECYYLKQYSANFLCFD